MEHSIFDAGPEIPKSILPEPKHDLVEKILDMDDETFRKLFMQKVDLQRSEDHEMNDLD
jgi:hypothetical protein